VYEKIRARVLGSVHEGSPVKRAMFAWALDLGRRVFLAREQGQEPGPWTAVELKLADQLVFSKVRERTGGRLRCCISGGAALPREVGIFFQILGISVLEGYGLTESSPVIAVNRPGRVRMGTVGEAYTDVEIKIADDGEIMAGPQHHARLLQQRGGDTRGHHP
jgi:long-chain acyl-CoA synthetase